MSSPLTDADRIRAILDHLEIRFDERLKAILALQGLVFAALGFSWGTIVGMPLLLSIVGILATAALIGEAERTHAAAAKIISWWRQHNSAYGGPPVLEERFEMGRKLLKR